MFIYTKIQCPHIESIQNIHFTIHDNNTIQYTTHNIIHLTIKHIFSYDFYDRLYNKKKNN